MIRTSMDHIDWRTFDLRNEIIRPALGSTTRCSSRLWSRWIPHLDMAISTGNAAIAGADAVAISGLTEGIALNLKPRLCCWAEHASNTESNVIHPLKTPDGV